MKTYRKEFWFNTPHRRDFIYIAGNIEQCLAEAGIKEGNRERCRNLYKS